MICPNCRNQVVDEADFCPYCGTKLKELKDNIIQSQNNIQQSQYTFQQFDNNVKIPRNKKKSSILPLVIVLIVIFAFIFGIGYLGYIGLSYFSKYVINNDDEIVEETQKYNSLEKITMDYETGILSINDYFTQLVYLEFDSSKLDEKYVSDYDFYITNCEFNTDEIIEQYYDELDEDIVKLYLTNITLVNILLSDEEQIQQQSNDNQNQNVVLLNDDNIGKASNHRLNKVYLSSNGNFLIWYTDSGDDAITDEELKELANGLENSISSYEKFFEVKYSYTPYIDNKYFNDDWKNAKDLLTKNNLSTSILQSAMSVYVYDTGSESILANYNDETVVTKLVNRLSIFGLLDDDGIVNYPYIIINKRGFNNNNDLVTLYNHELFHHMQYLYCNETTNKRCVAGTTLGEGMANFASSYVSRVTDTNSFLNRWADIYVENTSTKLTEITNKSGSNGYALYLYFNAYANNVNNWKDVLMKSHTKSDAFSYIQSVTNKDDLVKVINYLAYNTLSQQYDNLSLISSSEINFKTELKSGQNYELDIKPGAIDYFELLKGFDIEVNTQDIEYVTLKVYGYKNGTYREIADSSEKIELTISDDYNYDKFYLVVTNGNLLNDYNYNIKVNESNTNDNSSVNTSFNNYNIEINMHTKTSGIEVKSISSGTVDELNQTEYLECKTTTMGITVSNKIYYDFNTGYSYSSIPYNDNSWVKDKNSLQIVNLENIMEKLMNMDDVVEETNNHFKVKMSKNDLKEIMTYANSDISAINGDIYVDVYIEDGYIKTLEYDFASSLKEFDIFTIEISFSNYNNAGNVEIPDDVIKNAKGA